MLSLKTDRLLLRPVRSSDAGDIESLIFSQAEIVKGLAHNGADPDRRRYHAREWSGFGPDGGHDFWDACQMGLYVIHDRSGTIADKDSFLGVCGVFLECGADRWNGELFYALALPYQGRGIMSEAATAVLRRFDQLPKAGHLYAVYWQLLNPASGRILQKIGFQPAGTRALLDEYPLELYQGVREFELWRLDKTPSGSCITALREVAIKLGHLEREAIGSREDNLKSLRLIIGKQAEDTAVEGWLNEGLATPGFGFLTYHPRR